MIGIEFKNKEGQSIIYHLEGNIFKAIFYKILITLEIYWDSGRDERQGRYNIINKWMKKIYGKRTNKIRKK